MAGQSIERKAGRQQFDMRQLLDLLVAHRVGIEKVAVRISQAGLQKTGFEKPNVAKFGMNGRLAAIAQIPFNETAGQE